MAKLGAQIDRYGGLYMDREIEGNGGIEIRGQRHQRYRGEEIEDEV